MIGPVAGTGHTLGPLAALLRTLALVTPLVDGGRRRFAYLPAEPGSLEDLRDVTALLALDGGCNRKRFQCYPMSPLRPQKCFIVCCFSQCGRTSSQRLIPSIIINHHKDE